MADKPWEKSIGSYNTVLFDEGEFRMWYDVQTAEDACGRQRRVLCYACSDDGVNWKKPGLGVSTFDGSLMNNIVAPPSDESSQQGATVFKDPGAPARERYKLWTKYETSEKEKDQGKQTGLWAMVSPDGLHWELVEEGYPLRDTVDSPEEYRTAADTQSCVFWDAYEKHYTAFVRKKKHPENRGRTCAVGMMTTDDFRKWPESELIYEADEIDESMAVPGGEPGHTPVIDFYTPGGMKIPGVEEGYILLTTPYYHWRDDQYPSTIDIRLLVSRDGSQWWQPSEREPFLRLGQDGGAAAGMIFSNPWPVVHDEEIWLYYAGRGTDHRGKQGKRGKSGIFRARLRKDGFVSVDASQKGGECITPVIEFSGGSLVLNMDGSAGGWLQVEILSPEGEVIEGFSEKECEVVRGNSLRKSVNWAGDGDLEKLAGRPLRLRFIMCSMKLYSFQFAKE